MVALRRFNAFVTEQIASSFLTAAIGRVIRRLGAQVVEPEVLDTLGQRRRFFGRSSAHLVELRTKRRCGQALVVLVHH